MDGQTLFDGSSGNHGVLKEIEFSGLARSTCRKQSMRQLWNEPQPSLQYPSIREQSHFTQGAVASGKCAALIALKLAELVVQFCQAPRIGIIRQLFE